MRIETITLAQAAQWCGGSVAQTDAARTFRGANFDTRRLQSGELFVALKGERNGHAFARTAMELGAAAVLASEPVDAPAIYVGDTLTALQDIARNLRRTLACRVVGITGSVGKTTTKEMTAAVLETQMPTVRTERNFNNGIGLPVTVLGIPTDCRAAVLEMGMNHFGELSVLTRIAQPDIAVITNIGTMHIENLGSREGILKAKLEILEGLRPGGKAVFNGDDDLLAREAARCGALTFGLGAHCDVRATDVESTDEMTCFTVTAFGNTFPVELPLPGEHNVLDALAAIAVGSLCGVSPEHMQAALRAFRSSGHRQNHYTRGGVQVFDDCYNAGPESMRAALGVLGRVRGRKFAVLGGMLELGEFAPQAHYEVGRLAAHCADELLAYGACSEEYVRGAKDAGMECARCFATHEELAQALRRQLKSGDALLCKGSRGMKMERVLQLLWNERETGGETNG